MWMDHQCKFQSYRTNSDQAISISDTISAIYRLQESPFQTKMAETLTLPAYVWELAGLNLSRDTSYPD
jgi:hypothetical protein